MADQSPYRPTPKGRGATENPPCRYDATRREAVDDGWGACDPEVPRLDTTVVVDNTRTILTRNQSPDVPFDQSINPYRGCEHGCVYCFARPTHAYLGWSPGLDFESRLLAKPRAAELLRAELARARYQCAPVAMGTNTDPYQPVEREWRITRGVLEVLAECHHPVSIVTKSSLIERDRDLLAEMAARRQAQVIVSVTTLDRTLSRWMEPRAAAPARRLKTVARLAEAGIPVGVLVAPIIPGLTDEEMERILQACREAGAQSANYVLLRLPLETAELFDQWLARHYPLKHGRVMQQIRDARGGELYESGFGVRGRGRGPYAALLGRRFALACKRLGFNRDPVKLDVTRFRRPGCTDDGQLALF